MGLVKLVAEKCLAGTGAQLVTNRVVEKFVYGRLADLFFMQ